MHSFKQLQKWRGRRNPPLQSRTVRSRAGSRTSGGKFIWPRLTVLIAAIVPLSSISAAEVEAEPVKNRSPLSRHGAEENEVRSNVLAVKPDLPFSLYHATDSKRIRGTPQAGEQASTGLTPLTDLGAEERYKEQDGGLYGGGRNHPPPSHFRAALDQAAKIQPLDANGRPAADGRIVLISNGMSNTTQEFQAFMQRASGNPRKAPAVVLVDGAQGGMEAFDWAHAERRIRPDRPDPWEVLDQRLAQAGVTAEQVQVVWIKQARRNPASLGEFPRHAEELKDNLTVLLQKLHKRFPNLRLAYLSSRIYAGYATTPLNPEPYAYESAFAVRWLIQDQIQGKPELNYDPERGEVKAPLALWGAYLWADGIQGRRSDSLVWRREDLAHDGTHPSLSGRQKAGELLFDFFVSEPTAKSWFARAQTDGTAPSPRRMRHVPTDSDHGWRQVSVAGPSARHSPAMAYDSRRGVIVLFGGMDGGPRDDYSLLGDTWEWDGTAWTKVAETGPSPRMGHDMVYDSRRGVTVLFGREQGDTWEWNGTEWKQAAATGPRWRGRHAMAYDSRRGVTVLFGGIPRELGDTWEWDGAEWREIDTGQSAPSGRARHAMAYDARRGLTLLFGGQRDGRPLGDTWTWDGVKWEKLDIPEPWARSRHAMLYDSRRNVMVVFGGMPYRNDTLEWDGREWRQVATAGPRSRVYYGMACHEDSGTGVLFGGWDGNKALDDTWVYEPGNKDEEPE